MPAQVLLTFDTEDDKNTFLEGLADTWGEREYFVPQWKGRLQDTTKVHVRFGEHVHEPDFLDDDIDEFDYLDYEALEPSEWEDK